MKYIKKIKVLTGILLINSTFILTSCSNNNIKSEVNIETSENSINQEIKTNDEIILEYFESSERKIEQILNDGNKEKAKQEISEIVVMLVDFLFYNGQIKGITLHEISAESKQQILDITINIDKKIENKLPNYKEEISEKSKSALNWLKEKGQISVDKIDEFFYENIENYDKVKEEFTEVVENTKGDYEEVKDITVEGFSKIKSYYETWRENVKND